MNGLYPIIRRVRRPLIDPDYRVAAPVAVLPLEEETVPDAPLAAGPVVDPVQPANSEVIIHAKGVSKRDPK